MRIEQLENLIEVVKYGSISAVAKKIFVSQQSLNKSLNRLENELETQILHRTKKGVTLTEKGEIVYRGASAIIKRYYEMLEDLQGDVDMDVNIQISGKLSIYISPMLNISVLPNAFVNYSHRYPKMQIYCQEKYRIDILEEVKNNSSHLGILLVPITLENFADQVPENVKLYKLKEYPIYMAMSPRHPLSHHHKLSVTAISEWPVIVYETGGITGKHAFQDHENFRVALSTSNYQICQKMLSEGETLMYSFPPYMERGVFADFVHIPVHDNRAFFNCYLAVNSEATSKELKAIESFSQVFQEYL